MIQEQILCEYGCGNIAKFKFKNGKWCCSKKNNYCKGFLSSIGKKNKGVKQKKTEKTMQISTMELCSYGCGKKAKYQFKNGKLCCSLNIMKCTSIASAFGESNKGKHKGKIPWNRNLTKETDERLEKISQKNKNQVPWHKDKCKENNESIRRISEKNSVWMKEWGSAHANRFLKKKSKPQTKLEQIIMQICPYAEPQYPVYRCGDRRKCYSIDIAVPKLDLAIEFDGWRNHFDSEESKERHKTRQKEIEEEGWKFLRYNIYQKFPTLEQVGKDILKVIN